MPAVIFADGLAILGRGSEFIVYLTVGSVVIIAVALFARSRTRRQGLRDLLGITATVLVLVLAAMAMIIGEYLLG
jgi:hypothetical protein